MISVPLYVAESLPSYSAPPTLFSRATCQRSAVSQTRLAVVCFAIFTRNFPSLRAPSGNASLSMSWPVAPRTLHCTRLQELRGYRKAGPVCTHPRLSSRRLAAALSDALSCCHWPNCRGRTRRTTPGFCWSCRSAQCVAPVQ